MAKQSKTAAENNETPIVTETNPAIEDPILSETGAAKEILAVAENTQEAVIPSDTTNNKDTEEQPEYLKALVPTSPEFINEAKESAFNSVDPIKPVLSDQLIQQDFSQSSKVKVLNEQGVTVNLSGTAAKILKSLDANTKIVG
jgi:hypothetical protein